MKEVKFKIHLTDDKYIISSVEVDDNSSDSSIEARIENSFMRWINDNMWWEITE